MFTLKMRKCSAGDNENVTVGGGWDGELGEGTPWVLIVSALRANAC